MTDDRKLLREILTHDGLRTEPSAAVRTRLAELRRETVERPVIFLGAGSCGRAAGEPELEKAVRKWLDSNGKKAEIVETGCAGLCSEEPLMDVRLPGRPRVSFRRVDPAKAERILKRLFSGENPEPEDSLGQISSPGLAAWPGIPELAEHPFFRGQTRRVLARCGLISPDSIAEAVAHGAYRALATALHTMTPAEVCQLVTDSNLRGRGGGGFPAGIKWRTAREVHSDQKYLICNADEGDTGSFTDRAILEGDPHLLIEGIAAAAYAVGAGTAILYTRTEYTLAAGRIERAAEEAKRWGFLGDNILDSGFDLKFQVRKMPGAFVCGEETAMISALEGRRGMPRPRPPYPAVRGLFGKPTVINNVETLANVPWILLNGPEKFRSLGTASDAGTKIFSLSGKTLRTGLVEVPFGTPLRKILFENGGGMPPGAVFKAVQTGGPSGGCLPESMLDIPAGYESLRNAGAMIGSGGLIVLDGSDCMVDTVRSMIAFLQHQSCGKCAPCREGTRQMLRILESIARGRSGEGRGDALRRINGVILMEKLASVMRETSLCGLGRTVPNAVDSALRWFREEFEEHVFERRCPAGVCRDLRRYAIDRALCRDCGFCASACPENLIHGPPWTIDPARCSGCGKCESKCKFGAVKCLK